MPAPTPEDINLACRGARAALERLRLARRPGDGDSSEGRLAAVETLWWVRLLAEQLAYPGNRLTGDGTESDEAELVAALRVVRNTVTHKVPIVAAHEHAEMRLGTNLILGETKFGGEVELCWIPTDELPKPDPRFAKHWEKDKADYATHVAGEPCYASLHRAVRWLTGDAPKYRSDGAPVVLASGAEDAETKRELDGSGVVLG
ncbi:hypothetical protein [Corynebacterium nuruki]|uniref:hypothetical protein n=1 Tax=Corynebacterium nuruki TaxID=1032851 RepID=UPI0002486FA2|nr:hypothetical protein [Corynebacterium nuruki]